MNKFTIGLRKSSPTILTCLGVAGVIGTAVMAVRATPKALKRVEERKEELQTDQLNPKDLVLATWQCYIPSALIGVGTIICIAGISIMDRRNQAALTSAYAMLNESYKQYRQAAKRAYGEDADNRIHAEMAKGMLVQDRCFGYQVYDANMDPESELLLFYDLSSKKYFNSTMAAVLNAQYHVNRTLAIEGMCSLNDYLSFLGVSGVENGDKVGWDIENMFGYIEYYWLEFHNQKEIIEDGLECIIINTMEVNEIEYE